MCMLGSLADSVRARALITCLPNQRSNRWLTRKRSLLSTALNSRASSLAVKKERPVGQVQSMLAISRQSGPSS
jgi:hypothetical protein